MNLLHEIEDRLTNDDDITADETRLLIKQYDEIISNMEFQIPDRICKKIKENYKGKRYLPIILINSAEDEPTNKRSSGSFPRTREPSAEIVVVDVPLGEQL